MRTVRDLWWEDDDTLYVLFDDTGRTERFEGVTITSVEFESSGESEGVEIVPIEMVPIEMVPR